jgi:DNA-binding HxlR family transcriptional regulator
MVNRSSEGKSMARKYSMRCSIASTLDIIGDRWTILILRDLFLHPTRRFQDFEASLPGLTPGVLSTRIKELTAHGILTSRLYAQHPPRPEYLLTPKGRALNPILIAMKAWGEQYVASPPAAASLQSDLRP